MKINIYINSSGLEALAKEETLYSHHFAAYLDGYAFIPKGAAYLAGVEWVPSTNKAANTKEAVQALQAELQEFRVQALRVDQSLVERINNLLALKGPSA
jgi:hypothetical protein